MVKKISNQQQLDLEAVLKDGASSILATINHFLKSFKFL